jgi:hypothetical protein
MGDGLTLDACRKAGYYRRRLVATCIKLAVGFRIEFNNFKLFLSEPFLTLAFGEIAPVEVNVSGSRDRGIARSAPPW